MASSSVSGLKYSDKIRTEGRTCHKVNEDIFCAKMARFRFEISFGYHRFVSCLFRLVVDDR
ncbi:MAG: hypothetical protein V1754_05225 [Pseudomonadota bacterium]